MNDGLDTVVATTTQIKVCKHWKLTGKCVFAENCKFSHPSIDHETLLSNRADYNSKLTPKLRRVVKNEGRAAAFRRWLLRTYGADYLNSFSGIVDVAGGKGELSFELLNINGIHSTVFDPRPLDVTYFARKLRNGFYHKNEALAVYNVNLSRTGSDNTDHQLPRHICGYFEMHATTMLVCKVCKPKAAAIVESSICLEVLNSSSAYHYPMALKSPDTLAEAALQDLGEEGVGSDSVQQSADLDWASARRTVRDCSIIVGMHPDQARCSQKILSL